MASIPPPNQIRRSLTLRPEQRIRITLEDPQLDSEAHDHLFHEIAYIRSGQAEHHTAAGVELIGPGAIIIIRPQVWHAYLKCRKMVLVNCLFNSALLYQLMPLLIDAPQVTDLLRTQSSQPANAAPVVLHAGASTQKEIEPLLARMLNEQTQLDRSWQSACTADLLRLLVLIARLLKPVAHTKLSPATNAAILTAAHHIEAHVTDTVSLSMLAELTGMSKGHLSRQFSVRMGMGIVDYQHRLRVEEACRLLRLTDLSITHIAARTGYAEVAYFSRCFRRMMGLSPRDYRQGRRAIELARQHRKIS